MITNPFKPKTKEEQQIDTINFILHTLKTSNFNHSQKAYIINQVNKGLVNEREMIIDDIVNANSI